MEREKQTEGEKKVDQRKKNPDNFPGTGRNPPKQDSANGERKKITYTQEKNQGVSTVKKRGVGRRREK